ncbi:hypothetical protein BO94DRAFT_222507 [Aspergillus sclerotioniger CBS 115572]|uniref:Uncharacterized protein n=1 Tax=Aspergillus sclerotioniger CBS 115572 TaxID=1450535 RepID=A0A317X9G4_9EURO|nr:hypothetical protein BO94DRAFT_222507 [Aspergillus sclerotioniger CBS 115572]PWY95243.1 hypothetical protein BO94DRAFT_222507 [Aspergillus sclerotioniger CBS 115572]
MSAKETAPARSSQRSEHSGSQEMKRKSSSSSSSRHTQQSGPKFFLKYMAEAQSDTNGPLLKINGAKASANVYNRERRSSSSHHSSSHRCNCCSLIGSWIFVLLVFLCLMITVFLFLFFPPYLFMYFPPDTFPLLVPSLYASAIIAYGLGHLWVLLSC